MLINIADDIKIDLDKIVLIKLHEGSNWSEETKSPKIGRYTKSRNLIEKLLGKPKEHIYQPINRYGKIEIDGKVYYQNPTRNDDSIVKTEESEDVEVCEFYRKWIYESPYRPYISFRTVDGNYADMEFDSYQEAKNYFDEIKK